MRFLPKEVREEHFEGMNRIGSIPPLLDTGRRLMYVIALESVSGLPALISKFGIDLLKQTYYAIDRVVFNITAF